MRRSLPLRSSRAVATTVAVMMCGTLACSGARYESRETGAPTLILPARFAEGHTGKPAADGGAPGAAAGPGGPGAAPSRSALPDPEPLVTAEQWVYELDYSRGDVKVASVKPVHLERPAPTARRMGRFAVELWLGAELIDRVRFDFPLLAADSPPEGPRKPLHDAPRFAPGAESHARVVVPGSDRATAARLVDRLTSKVFALAWPPPVGEPSPSAATVPPPASP